MTIAQNVDSNYVDGQIYAKVKQSSNVVLLPDSNNNITLSNIYSSYGVDSVTRPFYGMNDTLDRIYRVYFSQQSNYDQLITAFENIPFIEYAEQVPLYYRNHTPNDPELSQQYHLDKIKAELAWDSSKGSSSVVVAVVDNAVLLSHEDLNANIWENSDESPNSIPADQDANGYPNDINGYDVADDDNDPSPPSNISDTSAFIHGTATAGIAASVTNNGKGVASIGYNLSIMAVKCSPNSSDGRIITNADDGVFYAARNNADIISMSYGSSGNALTSETVINTAQENGAVMVGAAGNNNQNEVLYPAAYEQVFAVGATNSNDEKASYSNYGSDIDVMAPGSNIYTTSAGTNSSYKPLWGTSMACPLVAGLAGLYKAENPNAGASAIKQALKNGCDNIDSINQSYTGQLGAGRINAYATLGGDTTLPTVDQYDTNEPKLSVSPNPVSDYLSLHLAINKGADPVTIQLFNLKGQLVYQKQLAGHRSKVKLSLPDDLQEGLYLFSAKNDAFSRSRKVLIAK